jgi:hypothetical protein
MLDQCAVNVKRRGQKNQKGFEDSALLATGHYVVSCAMAGAKKKSSKVLVVKTPREPVPKSRRQAYRRERSEMVWLS